MSRRKRTLIPERLSGAKIQRLSWNMTDDMNSEDILCCNDEHSDDGVSAAGCQQALLSFERRKCDEIELELKLNDEITFESMVGLLGSFSAAKIKRRIFSTREFMNEHPHCGLVIKLANAVNKNVPEYTDASGISQRCVIGERSRDLLEEFTFVECNVSSERISALDYLQKNGFISVTVKDEGTDSSNVELLVYLNNKAVRKVALASEDPSLKKQDKMMKIVMEWFHGSSLHVPNASESSFVCGYDDNMESLFDALKRKRDSSQMDNVCESAQIEDLDQLQHPALVPGLRLYQKKSVKWMIERETKAVKFSAEKDELHPLWRAIHIGDDFVYYNPYTGWISGEKFLNRGSVPGGILADEMGLGKTIEVLACILNHPMGQPPQSEERSGSNNMHETTEEMLDKKIMFSEANLLPEFFSEEKQLDSNVKMSPNLNYRLKNIVDSASATKEEDSCSGKSHLSTAGLPAVAEEECLVRCTCGQDTASTQEDMMKCSVCAFAQHSICIGMKRNSEEEYVCPDCIVTMPLVESRATLIISPVTIAHQWLDEIHHHILPGSLDVLVYEGVAKQGFMYPSVLADNDIILTTYDVLKRDFDHLASRKNSKSFRHRKRYASWPCPLTCIKFWRICLDEAQMVENTTAKATETALNLSAVHRWCVTGTPVQRGVGDLYGLFLFLGVEPYYIKTWWKKLLYKPFLSGNYKPLLDVLCHILWRTAKNDVIHEISLPEQKESVKWLNFSPVEDHFYRRQHQDCSSFALKELNKFQESMTKLNSLDKYSIQRIMGPLLRLRQACCHPQVVRGGFISFQKSTITMEQLLESMIGKAKKESEEAHRLLLCAMNGLAGMQILQGNCQQAVDVYREAMGSWREHEELIKTDSLQKLHTLHNLDDVLKQRPTGCSRTLRDDFLKQEASEISEQYLKKWQDQVKVAEAEVTRARKAQWELREKIDLKCPWWIAFLQDVLDSEDNMSGDRKLSGKLIEKVKDDLAAISNGGELGLLDMADRFSDLRGLQFLLVSKFEDIENSQESLFRELEQLLVEPSKEMIISAAECCLRPACDSKAKRCHFCRADDVFSEHESLLFAHQGVNNIDVESQQIAGGLRGETEAERSLKSIYSFLKAQRKHGQTYLDLQQQAQSHFEYLEVMKKNFKVYRQLWFALRERVSALDELEMCTMRLRLRYPGEVVEENQFHIINPLEIDAVQMSFRSDKIVASSNLRKALGQLLYLKNLAKTRTEDGGRNVEPCPVCTRTLGFQWSVFSCGHCICCDCMWTLLEQPGIPGRVGGCVKCPLCRTATPKQDISYVTTATKLTEEDKDLVVKGSHSTKIEAIVRTLMRIKRTDALAKTLVFSTWQDVLEHVSYALKENDMNHRCIRGRKDFQDSLEEFKTAADISILLLPLQSGSNGLNIIEATHVVLVEPSLNPSLEMQAVGRVHRIGQTKPTFIHRLLIGNTVEEKIMTFLRKKTVSGIRCGTRKADKDNIPLTVGELASFFEPA